MTSRKRKPWSRNSSFRSLLWTFCIVITVVALSPNASPTDPGCTNNTDDPQGQVTCPASDPCPLIAGGLCSGQKFTQVNPFVNKSICKIKSGGNYELVEIDCTRKTVCLLTTHNGVNSCVGTGLVSYVTVPQCKDKGGNCSL